MDAVFAFLIAVLVWLLRPVACPPRAARALALWMASRGLFRLAQPSAADRQPRPPAAGCRAGCRRMRRRSAVSSATGVRKHQLADP